jgi:adenylate cyclase class 2
MRAGCALRVRRDGERCYLTYKGPWQKGPVKAREEIETTVGSAETLEAVLAALGYQPWFRSQKFREEYALGAAVVTVDETPFGVFVEIEADANEIARVAALLGRSQADYRLESYPALWRRWCHEHGLTPRDMVFDRMA